MDIKQFRKHMQNGNHIELGSELFEMFHKYSQEALKITMELNNKYHTPEEIVEIMTQLTGRKVDKNLLKKSRYKCLRIYYYVLLCC